MKKLLSWILVLALCLSLFPGVALAEDAEEPAGEIAPVEEPVPSLEGDDGGLSGTPAPTEEDQAGDPAGDGVPDVPSAVPEGEPVASGSCGADLNWAYYEKACSTSPAPGACEILTMEMPLGTSIGIPSPNCSFPRG